MTRKRQLTDIVRGERLRWRDYRGGVLGDRGRAGERSSDVGAVEFVRKRSRKAEIECAASNERALP